MPSWKRFTDEFRKDLKQWLFFMAALSFFRVVFILFFRSKIEPSTPWTDIVKALVNGMRYDAVTASLVILAPLFLTVLSGFLDLRRFSRFLKRIYGGVFIVVTSVVSMITLAYFREYNDHFNHFVFNLYYDDTRAILSTIWAEYNPVMYLSAAGALSFVLLKAFAVFMKSSVLEARPGGTTLPVLLRGVAVVSVVLLLLAGARGSYGHRTVKIEDAAVTRDAFLNKAVLNPYSALKYAYVAHMRVSFVMTGLQFWLPDGDVRKAARTLYRDPRRLDNLDEYLKRTAQGHRSRPEHIFLTVMESFDAWPLLEEYASLGLAPELDALARKGIHFRNFLPSSDGTATSLTALLSGLADANVVTNYQNSSSAVYPSSIAESFKRLGYRTRFFYGGYLSWQKIGAFVRGQGFDEVYGAAHIGSWASHNEWGVEDEALFDFVIQTVGAAGPAPSLNVILTTSYHPPYELDVYGKGFPLTAVPAGLTDKFDNTVSLRMLGHLWYSDKCIGDFVRKAENMYARSLFAFTGDHFSRKFINISPSKYEASTVPFVLYGKKVLRGVSVHPKTAGSHIDIAPTLIELTAPRGFAYYGVGRSLLGREPKRFGINRDRIITADYLYDIWEKKFYPLPGKALPVTLPDPADLKLLHGAQAGISWWRIMRGPELNSSTPHSVAVTNQ